MVNRSDLKTMLDWYFKSLAKTKTWFARKIGIRMSKGNRKHPNVEHADGSGSNHVHENKKAFSLKDWVARVKENPAIILIGAAIALIGFLAGRIGDVEKLWTYTNEWRNYSRLVRPYPHRLTFEQVK